MVGVSSAECVCDQVAECHEMDVVVGRGICRMAAPAPAGAKPPPLPAAAAPNPLMEKLKELQQVLRAVYQHDFVPDDSPTRLIREIVQTSASTLLTAEKGRMVLEVCCGHHELREFSRSFL